MPLCWFHHTLAHLNFNSLHAGYFFMIFVVCFFSKIYFSKHSSRTLSECQMVCIPIRTDLVWVQTVCKGYQQMTNVSLERKAIDSTAKPNHLFWFHQVIDIK